MARISSMSSGAESGTRLPGRVMMDFLSGALRGMDVAANGRNDRFVARVEGDHGDVAVSHPKSGP
jgi:hypothetical protein